MASQRSQLDQRRRQLQTRMPEHFCHRCTAVVYQEDPACLECEQPVPQKGWISLVESTDPWLGRVLGGRYLLTKAIGNGASASVYRAESLAISRQFAIKVIHPSTHAKGPTPEQIAQRLEREIDAIGRLRNPHVVRFYDVLELPLQHLGVVMDFVAGDTLERVVERDGPLSLDRTVKLLRQTCNGLYEAHLSWMTHRDLKPENIMVERLPIGDEFVHVLDFGIVYVDGSVEMTHGFIGTPLYASPEQAMGLGVDRKSDIYSLGAICFFMLTGRPPFVGTNVMQVLKQHVDVQPPTMSSIRKDIAIPPILEDLVARMLAKEPKDRPEDLSEVIQILDQTSSSFSSRPLSMGIGSLRVTFPSIAELVKDSSAASASSVESVESVEQEPPKAMVMQQSQIISRKSGPHKMLAATARHKGGFVSDEFMPDSASSMPESLHESTHPGLVGSVQIDLLIDQPIRACSGQNSLRFAFVQQKSIALHDLSKATSDNLYPVEMPELITSMHLGDENVLIGDKSGNVKSLDFESSQCVELFSSVFASPVVSVCQDDSRKLMFALMKSGRVYVSPSHKTNRDWVRARDLTSEGVTMCLSPRIDMIAIARADHVVETSRVSDLKNVQSSISIHEPIKRLAFSNDGYLLGVLLERSRFQIYQLLNDRKILDLQLPQGADVCDIFFSAQTNQVIGFVKQDGNLYAMDIQHLSD